MSPFGAETPLFDRELYEELAVRAGQRAHTLAELAGQRARGELDGDELCREAVRELHGFAGEAQMMDLRDIGALAHDLELRLRGARQIDAARGEQVGRWCAALGSLVMASIDARSDALAGLRAEIDRAMPKT